MPNINELNQFPQLKNALESFLNTLSQNKNVVVIGDVSNNQFKLAANLDNTLTNAANASNGQQKLIEILSENTSDFYEYTAYDLSKIRKQGYEFTTDGLLVALIS